MKKILKQNIWTFILIAFSIPVLHVQSQPIPSKQSLAVLKYAPLPLGAIKPKGWLYYQLLTMKNGSTGHLDEYYPKIKNDNGWLGGKSDGWEETPYWLDGALPLAYLLNDDTLKAKVLKYVNWTLDHQRASGFFGPYTKEELAGKTTADCTNGADWWPRMIMLKVLQQYYSATNDARIIPFMTKYFHYQLSNLKKCSLGKWSEWATSRGGDNVMIVYWLYRITGDKSLLQLGDLLYKETTPWTTLLGARNWVMNAAAQQNDAHWMDRHGVNVAMGIKLPAIYYEAAKNKAYLDSLKTGYADIMTLHGEPHGMFSADEDLHGNEPSQGTELCAVVETMFSLEEILSITGDLSYADAIERICFNALPAQTTDDYISRQYFQMANQVEIKRGVYDFSLPFDKGMNNVFGPYAGYTCCTANMHQGFTKFVENLWYKIPSNGLAALLYSPNSVTAKVGNTNTSVTIDEQSKYPFNDEIHFIMHTHKAVAFPLELHIPQWCKTASVLINGKLMQIKNTGRSVTLNRTWNNDDSIVLKLPMKIITTNWARNSRAVERGPLVYALKINEKWTKDSLPAGERNYSNGYYYNVEPESDWNFGLLKSMIDDSANHVRVITHPFDETKPWSQNNIPIEIITTGKQIPAWKLDINGVAILPVTTRENIYQGEADKEEKEITLIPYGCTKLRIVAFPVVPE